MEQGQNTTQTQAQTSAPAPEQNMMAQGVNAKKKGKGALCGMIILGILAVGGIGFGVWTMMDGKAQKEALNEQISTLKRQNDELQEKLNGAIATATDADADVSTVNTADYIYIGEWGLKIKIPEGLKSVSYVINNNSDDICVTGVASSATEEAEFADLSKNYPGLGCILRVEQGTERALLGVVAFSDDSYDYIFNGSQAYYSTTEEMQTLEEQSRSLISDMLRTQDNYSKF